MNDQDPAPVTLAEPHESAFMRSFHKHQFLVMIVGSIVISIALVLLSLNLYVSSGTLQLDLSRPGYDEARKEAYANNQEVFRGFPSSGPIDKQVLDEFDALYADKTKDVSIQAFSGDALSDKALGLEVAE